MYYFRVNIIMKKCLTCQKTLIGKYKKKFCNASCAAKTNNKIPKRKKEGNLKICLNCNKEFYISPSKGKGKYCNINCMHEHYNKEFDNEIENLFNLGKLKYRDKIKRILLKRNGHKCLSCGLTEWNNQPIPLWVDHIDGCANNNNPENLRLVCLNCDALSKTFGGKNRGNGRRSLGLRPWD